MIRLNEQVPARIAVAVSGGADSMAALNFLSSKRDTTAVYFNHGTPHGDKAEKLVSQYCKDNDLSLLIGRIDTSQSPLSRSLEDFWREQRYNFFEMIAQTPTYSSIPFITCHHLDDVVETWLFTSFHGCGRLIPSRRGRYLRPFLMTRKAVLEDWCARHDVPYIVDPSNEDTRFMRNYIRHEIVPRTLRVNPGIYKVMRKKIKNNPVVLD
jgi:tRNA(Ile)-lysidine synthase